MATFAATQHNLRRAEASAVSVGRFRVESVDVLTGTVMILMALDHTRDFLGAATVSPTDPVQTTNPLILHTLDNTFCAPVLFLLTGTGTHLSLQRKSAGHRPGQTVSWLDRRGKSRKQFVNVCRFYRVAFDV